MITCCHRMRTGWFVGSKANISQNDAPLKLGEERKMSEIHTSPEIKKLSVAERILLVEEIWDSIAADQEFLEITLAQKQELDRRLDAYHASGDEGSSWEEVKKRITREK
jgi:putative addiction module component (TIGR02574 family)